MSTSCTGPRRKQRSTKPSETDCIGGSFSSKAEPAHGEATRSRRAWVSHSDSGSSAWRRVPRPRARGPVSRRFFRNSPAAMARIFTSNRIVPLPDETRRAVREKANSLPRRSTVAWTGKESSAANLTSAQILRALREKRSGYASRIDVKLVEQYFRSMPDPMRLLAPFPQGKHPNHLASHRGCCGPSHSTGSLPQERTRVSPLGPGQRRGWPLSGGRSRKVRLELRDGRRHTRRCTSNALQPTASRKAARPAGDRGADWLKTARRRPARWVDYPAWPEAQETSWGFGFRAFARASRGACARLARPRLAAELPAKRPPRSAAQPRRRRASRQPVLSRRDALLRAPLDDSRDGGGLRNAGISEKSVQCSGSSAPCPRASLYSSPDAKQTRRSPPKRCSPCGRGDSMIARSAAAALTRARARRDARQPHHRAFRSSNAFGHATPRPGTDTFFYPRGQSRLASASTLLVLDTEGRSSGQGTPKQRALIHARIYAARSTWAASCTRIRRPACASRRSASRIASCTNQGGAFSGRRARDERIGLIALARAGRSARPETRSGLAV